jgi:hypothetical protein
MATTAPALPRPKHPPRSSELSKSFNNTGMTTVRVDGRPRFEQSLKASVTSTVTEPASTQLSTAPTDWESRGLSLSHTRIATAASLAPVRLLNPLPGRDPRTEVGEQRACLIVKSRIRGGR